MRLLTTPAQRPGLRSRWFDFVLENHKAVLMMGVVFTLVMGALASQLRIDSNLRALLPKNGPVSRSFDSLEANYGANETLQIVVKGGSPEDRHAFADAAQERFADHPDIRRVRAKVDDDFFVQRALYYLSDVEMDELVERVDAWRHYELCTRAPEVCTLDPDPKAPEKLRALIDRHEAAARERVSFDGYFEREGIDALLVFLHPREPASNIEFCDNLYLSLTDELSALNSAHPEWGQAGVNYSMVGTCPGRAGERQILARDMLRSGLLGLCGVMVVLFSLFRSFRALLTLTVPLLAGLVWSMGAAYLLLGYLTTMTSLISSVLMGLGIDAGIHLLSRARRERRTHDDETSIRRAFDSLLAPLLVASTTTVGAFIVMSTSEYPAFREFGILAGAGVALCLLSMVTVYPALLKLVGIKEPPAERKGAGWLTHLLLDRPGLAFFGMLMLTVFSVPGVHQMRKDGFERNARELASDVARERVEADARIVSDIIGMNAQAAMLQLESYEQMERAYLAARAELTERQARDESVVADLVAAPRFLPDSKIDQQKRLEAIEALAEDFDEGTWARLEGKPELDEFGDPVGGGEAGEGTLSAEQVKDLRAMLAAQPFGPEDLPADLLEPLRGADGSWAIVAYPMHDAADVLWDVEFMEETADYGVREGGLIYAGEAAVPATMYTRMRDEWPVVLGMASILIFGIVLWQVRSFAQTMMTVLPLIFGLWWLLGFMGSAGVKFTLVNVPILPAILGIGVDNGVYLAVAIARRGETPEGLRLAVDATGRAILAATATTACGFASFMVADSGSLRSIGLLAFIGVLMAAFASLAVLPTLGELRARRRRDVNADGVVQPRDASVPITGPYPRVE